MNCRQLVGLLTAGLISTFSLSGQATPYAFEEGIHYKKLPDNARALVAKGTVQEFFFYGCTSATEFTLPLLANMGGTTGENYVFGDLLYKIFEYIICRYF